MLSAGLPFVLVGVFLHLVFTFVISRAFFESPWSSGVKGMTKAVVIGYGCFQFLVVVEPIIKQIPSGCTVHG